MIDYPNFGRQPPSIIRGKGGSVVIDYDGPSVEVDDDFFGEVVARAIAATMGKNIRRGLVPNGSRTMPGRRKDGRPRGKGSRISAMIMPIKTGKLEYLIGAHREIPGHLARILRGIPFSAPPYSAMRTALYRAFRQALRVVFR